MSTGLVGAERRDERARRLRRFRAGARARQSVREWERKRRAAGRWILALTPGSVAVRTRNHVRRAAALDRNAERGVVRGWSAKSKRRLRLRMASIPWPDVRYVFVTLTYPDEYPRDPAVWKRHLRAFFKAWSRQYGPARAVWAMEFQRRGAPHFHIVLVAPPGVGRDVDDQLPQVRRWYAATWHRIVTGCRGDHSRARDLGEGCVPWHYERHLEPEHCKEATNAREAISYIESELGKESQKSLPSYLDHDHQADGCDPSTCSEARGAGRWWGVVGFEPDEQEIRVTQREYVQLRHAVLRLGRECLKRELAHRERIRIWKLQHGHPWTRRPKPSGRWLSPRTINDGVVVMDPDLRAYSFARAFRAVLAEIRRPTVRVDGAIYPQTHERLIAHVLERIERSTPIVFGWA